MAEYAACEIVMGVIGGVAVVLSVVLIVAYRSYKYEQELDSLLWKIDPIDLKVNFAFLNCTAMVKCFESHIIRVYSMYQNKIFFRLVNMMQSQALSPIQNIQTFKDIVSVKVK